MRATDYVLHQVLNSNSVLQLMNTENYICRANTCMLLDSDSANVIRTSIWQNLQWLPLEKRVSSATALTTFHAIVPSPPPVSEAMHLIPFSVLPAVDVTSRCLNLQLHSSSALKGHTQELLFLGYDENLPSAGCNRTNGNIVPKKLLGTSNRDSQRQISSRWFNLICRWFYRVFRWTEYLHIFDSW